MITAEDNDGVLGKPALLQDLEEFANAVVDIADSTIVGPARALDLFVREVLVPQVADLEQSLAMGVLLVVRNPGDLWKIDLNIFVLIPVLLFNGVGIVGVSKRNLCMAAFC